MAILGDDIAEAVKHAATYDIGIGFCCFSGIGLDHPHVQRKNPQTGIGTDP
ncbi:MAG: hypothetical protein J5707_00185 [Candidatus Methanomethylophilus sp.]|nr:hypothetical protein [Methanomethylophilus sp.]